MIPGRTALRKPQREFWDANGYLVLPSFYSRRAVAPVNAVVDRMWDTRPHDTPIVIDVEIGTPNERRSYFRDIAQSARDRPYKLNDLFLVEPAVRDLALSPRLARVLSELVGGDVMICNGLYFERGSQQDYHFDTYYMPHPVVGGLVVSSVCLEDHHEDAGPLRYYPGSQAVPPYRFSTGERNAVPDEMGAATRYIEAQIAERGLTSESFTGRVGDVFIWHEQLFHGGSPIVDETRTRRSLVTHYWRADDFPIGEPWKRVRMGRHASYVDRPHQTVDRP